MIVQLKNVLTVLPALILKSLTPPCLGTLSSPDRQALCHIHDRDP